MNYTKSGSNGQYNGAKCRGWMLSRLFSRRKQTNYPHSAELQKPTAESMKSGGVVQIKSILAKVTVAEFADCMIDHNYRVLVISGEPTHEQLLQAWGDLQSEYYKTTGNDSISGIIKQMNTIHRNNIRVNAVFETINAIRQVMATYSALANYEQIFAELTPLFEELKTIGYQRPFTIDSIEADLKFIQAGENRYINDLNKAKAALKTKYSIDLDNPDSNKSGGDNGREFFVLQMDEIRKFDNYQKDPETLMHEMMMSTYCRALARLKKHNEYLENLNKNGK